MAPMTSDAANTRPRRQAFVATCSPDELLGQVIQTLCPRYKIDAPHLLALRRVLSSAIVAPRKPPTLKRTRPDKRIGEISSIDDTPRRSSYGPNGPPLSADRSFYFHHKDADFERLLPTVDRSRYEWSDEPASQSESDGEEIPDSQERMHSEVSTAATPFNEPQTQDPCPTVTSEPVSSDEQLLGSGLGPETAPKDTSADPQKRRNKSVPDIIITTPRSTETKLNSEHVDTPLSSPLLHAANVAIELPDTQGTHSVPPPPYTALPFYVSQSSDTQDTVNSVQQGEVFSPPNDFVHYTPPTQETQDETLSQIEDSSIHTHATLSKGKAIASSRSPRRSPQVPSSGLPAVPTPSQGKRPRGQSEVTGEAPLLKRSKSKEAA